MVKNSAQEGRAETSNEVCRRASERRPRYIRGLYPVSGQTGHLDKLASNCKLNYEPEGRSRAAEQILDFQIFRLEEKSDKTQRSGATFRALSTIIDFGRLQTLQGDELSLEPSYLELGVLSKLERQRRMWLPSSNKLKKMVLI